MIFKIFMGVIALGMYFSFTVALIDQARRPWVPFYTTEEIFVATKYGKICLTQDICPFNGIMKKYEESGDGERHKDRPQPMASQKDLAKLKEALKEVRQILDGVK